MVQFLKPINSFLRFAPRLTKMPTIMKRMMVVIFKDDKIYSMGGNQWHLGTSHPFE